MSAKDSPLDFRGSKDLTVDLTAPRRLELLPFPGEVGEVGVRDLTEPRLLPPLESGNSGFMTFMAPCIVCHGR